MPYMKNKGIVNKVIYWPGVHHHARNKASQPSRSYGPPLTLPVISFMPRQMAGIPGTPRLRPGPSPRSTGCRPSGGDRRRGHLPSRVSLCAGGGGAAAAAAPARSRRGAASAVAARLPCGRIARPPAAHRRRRRPADLPSAASRGTCACRRSTFAARSPRSLRRSRGRSSWWACGGRCGRASGGPLTSCCSGPPAGAGCWRSYAGGQWRRASSSGGPAAAGVGMGAAHGGLPLGVVSWAWAVFSAVARLAGAGMCGEGGRGVRHRFVCLPSELESDIGVDAYCKMGD